MKDCYPTRGEAEEIIDRVDPVVHRFTEFPGKAFIDLTGILTRTGRDLAGKQGLQLLGIHTAVRAAFDADDLKTGHRRAGGVGAVGAVGNDDFYAGDFPAAFVVPLDEQ